MTRLNLSIFLVAVAISMSNAFSTAFLGNGRIVRSSPARQSHGISMRVVDIDSEEAFDKTISSAGENLVVVDYSTTWCGPCKVIAPKFDEMSDKYPDAVFLKVRKESLLQLASYSPLLCLSMSYFLSSFLITFPLFTLFSTGNW